MGATSEERRDSGQGPKWKGTADRIWLQSPHLRGYAATAVTHSTNETNKKGNKQSKEVLLSVRKIVLIIN